jgi:hypothetical protein
MLNSTPQELSKKLYHALKERFPDINLVEIVENPFTHDSIWMRVIPPSDTQTRLQFSGLAAEMTTDILVDHDCDILITYAANPLITH